MKRLLFLILFLSIQGALAETGKIEIVGHAVDKMGNRSTVSIVELGRDRYLALSIKNDDKPEDATFAVVKREVDRLLEMIEKGARTRKNLSEGDLEILDSLGGGDSGLAVIRLHLSPLGNLTVLQVTEDGRERQLILDQDTWKALDPLIRRAERGL